MSMSRWAGVVLCAAGVAWAGQGAIGAAAPAAPAPPATPAAKAAPAAAGTAAPADALSARGLTKAGAVYVLPADEAAVLDAMKGLRDAKVASDKEVKARALLDGQMAAKQKIVKDTEKQYHELEGRLSVITKVDAHNAVVLRLRRLVLENKNALAAMKDLDEQAGKMSISAKTKFVDQLLVTNGKATEASEKYADAAADPAVKAALAKANPKAALGPSPAFASALDELKKWQGAVESEAIPLRAEHGTFAVDVLINGEKVAMGVDTGASSVTLTAEMADKLKVTPGPDAQVVQMRIANGAIIEGKEISLGAVRVGRFTVEGVRCVVLQPGLPDAPLLLGGSFLNHFIVKLDPSKQELQLTEIKEGGAKPAAKPAGGTGAAAPATPSK